MAEKGETTRARILDEAMRLASREGLEGLSIGLLATSLDMSKSGLFAHFGSREALQIATLEHAAGRLQARIAPVAQLPPGPGRPRFLFQVLRGWIDDPCLPGGCPVTAACFEFDDQEGPVRETLVAIQRVMLHGAAEVFEGFAHPAWNREQLAFEFNALVLAYHHGARLLRADRAADWAGTALEALILKAQLPPGR